MSDHQKEAFAERLRRIERAPGNGRMVQPGAADIFEDDKKKSKPGKMVGGPKKKRRPKVKSGLVYGLIAGLVMFIVWIGLYDGMSTPRNWGLDALPIPPRDAAISVGGIVAFGLVILQQFNLRLIFAMLFGILLGGCVLAALAAFVPDVGRVLTNETFVSQMRGIVSAIELE